MSRKARKQKNIHSDKYKNESVIHQAEVARDIARWEKERQTAAKASTSEQPAPPARTK